ncbi:MAG: DUF4446 family protein [Actinobacteria bacterium]|nr:DUF4446 family protein [Actinomycetota bacterium]
MTAPDSIYEWLALAAAATGLLSLCLLIWQSLSIRRLRRAQKLVLSGSERDIVRHAEELQREFVSLRDWIDENASAIDLRMAAAEARLDGAIAHSAMLRYDAYGEMTGRQSSSVALVDDKGTGVIITAIRHRAHSHLYVKQLLDGKSDIDLSPEEQEVLKRAFEHNPVSDPAAPAPPQPPRGEAFQAGPIRVQRAGGGDAAEPTDAQSATVEDTAKA